MEQLIWTGIPVIKSRRCFNAIPVALYERPPARITQDNLIMCENSCKALWGFRVVALWIGGGKGEGIRHGRSCDGRETPCHRQEQKIKD